MIRLTGYTGNVLMQLSSFDGRILRQKKLKTVSGKVTQQTLDISGYANGLYIITVIDEKGNRKIERMVIQR